MEEWAEFSKCGVYCNSYLHQIGYIKVTSYSEPVLKSQQEMKKIIWSQNYLWKLDKGIEQIILPLSMSSGIWLKFRGYFVFK